MKLFNNTLILGLTLLLGSCGKKQIIASEEGIRQNVIANEHLQGQILWVKNKKKELRAEILLTNNYSKPLVFPRESIQMRFDGKRGLITKNKFVGKIPSNGMIKGELSAEFYPPIDKEGSLEVKFMNLTLVDSAGHKIIRNVENLTLELELGKN